jgi:hypothetical protein
MNSTIVGISAWGFILGFIALIWGGKLEPDPLSWSLFAFVCIMGFFAMVFNMSNK